MGPALVHPSNQLDLSFGTERRQKPIASVEHLPPVLENDVVQRRRELRRFRAGERLTPRLLVLGSAPVARRLRAGFLEHEFRVARRERQGGHGGFHVAILDDRQTTEAVLPHQVFGNQRRVLAAVDLDDVEWIGRRPGLTGKRRQ